MKLKRNVLFPTSLFYLFIFVSKVFSQETKNMELYLEPIFHVNYGDATADKPQSKSWTNLYGQWVIVGDADGPKLLKKETRGWASQLDVNKAWHNLPPRADVFIKEDEAYIVLVGECALNVVQIAYSHQSKQYEHQWKESLSIPQGCQSLETATITRDSKNQYWVCADVDESIMIWHSLNGRYWSEPFVLADNINKDDISLIVSLKNQVSVIWSNQNTQSVMERIHYDGDQPNHWSDPIIVQQGDNNADDHLNATVFKNGELALVTKNSVDQINGPQFVLRIRDHGGRWTNIPYENLTAQRSPSRPIINHVESGKIYEAHSVKNKENNQYFISVNEIIRKENGWSFKELVQLKTKIQGKNGDVTSSKASFLSNGAKLIFFSDDLGNIYSFDLDTL